MGNKGTKKRNPEATQSAQTKVQAMPLSKAPTTPPSKATRQAPSATPNKVPKVTLLFWILKLAATALGVLAGKALFTSKDLEYLVAVELSAAVFALAVTAQLYRRTFSPLLYWFTLVAAIILGTILADVASRSLGLGHAVATALLGAGLGASLFAWQRSLGTLSIFPVNQPKAEMFYWITLLLSQAVGASLGEWTADRFGLGYGNGLIVFGTLLAVAAAGYYWTANPSMRPGTTTATLTPSTLMVRVSLFWAAFVITRPLGAAIGDFLEAPIASGGLALNRNSAMAALVCFILACIVFIPKLRKAKKPA